MKLKRKNLALATAALAVTGVAVAATLIAVQTPFKLSDGISGDKPKLQRMGDGTLVAIWGDSPAGAGMVYDVKADAERPARDVFSKFCKPDDTKTCNELGDWSPAINISNSALQSSTGTFDWQGTGSATAYPGDIDKPNVKTNGSVIVVTWVSKYCPDGDLSTSAIEPSVQRGVKYLERTPQRVIPFSCTWMSYSTNKGQSWRPAKQLSTGERDAIQDSSGGTFDSVTKTGKINVSWQEDPSGLKLGEADGPGDGASGATVSGGTDVWYAHAAVDLNQLAPAPADAYSTPYFNLQPAVRVTDNWQGLYGYTDTETTVQIYDGAGTLLDGIGVGQKVESGTAGASRPNIGLVGSTAIVAYEESKDSGGAAFGKFVRYHAFPYNNPPQDAVTNPVATIGTAGCIISDPAKNARRVRFLTQSTADAGAGAMQLAIFWKEGLTDNGGPSDIVVRRGVSGVQPANMLPAVDANCATSDYATAIALTSAKAENISSNTRTATTANLTDDTEANDTENALAHRGVLRGEDLWVGFSYTGDVAALATQQDNYNFWTRKFTVAGGWENPKNVSNITNKAINVREPRFFGTPKSNTDAGYCDNADPTLATDPSFCQDTQVVYAAWGTQTNVADPEDLGEYITVSLDGAATFSAPVKMSVAQGVLWGDDEAAYEAQPLTRPDGTRFYAVWNQKDLTTGNTYAEYTSGDVSIVPDPVPTPSSGDGGGCSMSQGQVPFDPTLPALAALGLIGLGLRRARRG